MKFIQHIIMKEKDIYLFKILNIISQYFCVTYLTKFLFNLKFLLSFELY